jgi:hypothetical protein
MYLNDFSSAVRYEVQVSGNDGGSLQGVGRGFLNQLSSSHAVCSSRIATKNASKVLRRCCCIDCSKPAQQLSSQCLYWLLLYYPTTTRITRISYNAFHVQCFGG